MSRDVVITAIARTPIGGFQGALSGCTAPQLGAATIQAVVERSGVDAAGVDEVIMGCVLSAGVGQAPARQAGLAAGLRPATGCTTVNKLCGSGMKAIMLAHDLIRAGANAVMIAGGLESMSNAPYLLPKARDGLRMGHGAVIDHMFLDGLEDAYDPGRLMGTFAEDTAADYGLTRERQDAFAITSLQRAQAAIERGDFADEITPVSVTGRGGDRIVRIDEQPHRAAVERIAQLRPAFRQDGTVTAANASSIADGAAALLLMTAAEAHRQGAVPLATIRGQATHAQAPAQFTTAPVGAVRKLLDQVGWQVNTVDLFEINEAFAVVTLAAIDDLRLPPERVNVNGGACALGHPIGASGARIVVTLIAALKRRGLRRGVAAVCIGGGEATAMAVELV